MTERFARHPNLTAWAVLAIGMLAILAWSARGTELNPRQWAALGVATVILAGACAWIISWEADDAKDAATAVATDSDTGKVAELADDAAVRDMTAGMSADAAPSEQTPGLIDAEASRGPGAQPEGQP